LLTKNRLKICTLHYYFQNVLASVNRDCISNCIVNGIIICAPSVYSNTSQEQQLNHQRHTSYQNIIYTPKQLTTASSLLCLPRRKKTTRHQLEFSGPPIVAI